MGNAEPFICETTGKPLTECEFEELEDSYCASTYQPDILHYSAQCKTCGEIMHGSRRWNPVTGKSLDHNINKAESA